MKHRTPTPARRLHQAGFSIMELMIGMTLSLIVISAAFGIFISNQQAYRLNENMSRMQESIRTAFEMMAREVRQAGGMACGPQTISNVLNNKNTEWSSNWANGTVIGYGSETVINDLPFGQATGQRKAGTEAIQVMSANLATSHTVTAHDTDAQTIQIQSATTDITRDLVVMLCDSDSAVMFQTGPVVANTISYGSSISNNDGNCTSNFGFFNTCDDAETKQFPAGSSITPITAAIWFIGNNKKGTPSLFRVSAGQTEEIAEGVKEMSTAYLPIDKNTGALGNDWIPVANITNWSEAAFAAVRIELKLETSASASTNNQPIERSLILVANLRNTRP